jgi:Superinfection immunity protein
MDLVEVNPFDFLAVLPALFILSLYFVPTIIARNRDVEDYGKIFFFNVLLGWTVIGWLAALIWSLRAKPFFGA